MKYHSFVTRSMMMAVASFIVCSTQIMSADEPTSTPAPTTETTPATEPEESVLDKAGFDTDIPTGVKVKIKEDESKKSPQSGNQFFPNRGHEFSVGIDAQVVHQFMDGPNKDMTRGTVATLIGYKVGPLALKLRLNPEEMVSRALGDEFEKQGDTYTNGIVTVNTHDIIEQAFATITVAQFRNDKGEEVVELYVSMGRGDVNEQGIVDDAEHLGTFRLPAWAAVGMLEDRSLSQLDQVKVGAQFAENTIVEATSFGYDWIGYTADPLKNIEQEGDGSFAISVSHKLENFLKSGANVRLFFSYANIEEGLVYTRAVTQPGENETFRGGVEVQWKKLTIATEAYYEQPQGNDLDDRYAVSVQAGYWIAKTIQPVIGFETRSEGDDNDNIISGGVNWAVFQNAIVGFLAQYVMPGNDSDEQMNFLVAVTLGQSLRPAMATDSRSED